MLLNWWWRFKRIFTNKYPRRNPICSFTQWYLYSPG